ncbi:MAG: YajD family HNH nuclease [bacterium]
MSASRAQPDAGRKAQLLDELHRDVDLRQQGYRMRALKLFPHLCGSCGREFSGKRLRELTVHHKDRNHENNPPDGSNWELLCVYCHDDAHDAGNFKGMGDVADRSGARAPSPIVSPFENLDRLFGESQFN